MKRRTFIQHTTTIALAAGMGITQASAMPTETTFIHHVFFWLHHPEQKQDLNQLVEALKKLRGVPTIVQSYIGFPAPTNREVVDNSYQVSWCVFFKSAADEEIYQSHPLHLQFVEENKHLWNKVVVYDSVGA